MWLDSPYQTPEWLSQLYEPEEEPSEEARLTTLREIFQSDSEYITASELTSELPPTHTEIDTLPLPRRCKHKYQDNQETPRQSLRIKTTAAVQAELEDWFIVSCAQGSSENIQLLTVWHIFTARLNYCKDYLGAANSFYNYNYITQQERQLFKGIHLRDRVADTDPECVQCCNICDMCCLIV